MSKMFFINILRKKIFLNSLQNQNKKGEGEQKIEVGLLLHPSLTITMIMTKKNSDPVAE